MPYRALTHFPSKSKGFVPIRTMHSHHLKRAIEMLISGRRAGGKPVEPRLVKYLPFLLREAQRRGMVLVDLPALDAPKDPGVPANPPTGEDDPNPFADYPDYHAAD